MARSSPRFTVVALCAVALVGCSFDPRVPKDGGTDLGLAPGDGDLPDSPALSGGEAGPMGDATAPADAPSRSDADAQASPGEVGPADVPQTGAEAGTEAGPVTPPVDVGPPGDRAPGDVDLPGDVGPVKLANGASCSSGTACISTFCVDGVCCESSCAGQCEACAQPGDTGRCLAVSGTPVGTRAACAGQGSACGASCNGTNRQSCSYPASEKECAAASCTGSTAYSSSVCDGKGACLPQTTVACGAGGCLGTICAGGCSASNPCPGGQFCSAGKCFPQQALGASCTAAGACTSGKCVDGVCCDAPCDGACQACNASGHCASVQSADDDKCIGKTCDASGACKDRPGVDCDGNADCASGACVDGKCCSQSTCGACQQCTGGGGTCVTVTNKIDADSCNGICDASGQCKSKQGQLCNDTSGGCVAGTTCAADGYCCNSACTGTCMACDLPGLLGVCSPVPSGSPHGKSCGTGACAGACSGRPDGMCTFPTGSCGAGPSCSAGMAVGQSTCMGGSCVAPAPQTCPLGCMGNVCKSGCSSNADCAAPKICVASECLKIEQISAGKHACVRLSDGSVRCWGQNTDGQIGDGSTTTAPTPVKVTLPAAATSIIAGERHTCAVLSSGIISCWGANAFGTGASSTTPVNAPALSGSVTLTAGSNFTCGLLATGAVKCPGMGGLGDGTFTGATALSGEYTHACAVFPDTTLKCWGSNFNGELGNGMTMPSQNTQVVKDVGGGTLTGATATASGAFFSCALVGGGAVKCWGDNTNGQLGNGAHGSSSPTPVTVTGLSGASAIDATIHVACALVSGTVKCWGLNNSWQLGQNPSTTPLSDVPLTIGGLSGVTAIAVGAELQCALLSDGTVKCWGGGGIGGTPTLVTGW